MALPRTAADVLSEHVGFDIESIDRMYLNVYQSHDGSPAASGSEERLRLAHQRRRGRDRLPQVT